MQSLISSDLAVPQPNQGESHGKESVDKEEYRPQSGQARSFTKMPGYLQQASANESKPQKTTPLPQVLIYNLQPRRKSWQTKNQPARFLVSTPTSTEKVLSCLKMQSSRKQAHCLPHVALCCRLSTHQHQFPAWKAFSPTETDAVQNCPRTTEKDDPFWVVLFFFENAH